MAYTAYATYFIFFQDPTEYDAAIVSVGGSPETGGHIYLSPADAADRFGITNPYPTGNVGSITKGIQFLYPWIPSLEIFHPAASGVFVDDNVSEMTVPEQTVGGILSPEMTLIWDGQIMFSGSHDNTDSRRFIIGFETSPVAEGNFVVTEARQSRDSSRTIEGIGVPIRGRVNVNRFTRNINQYTGTTTNNSWERFYYRIRALGSADVKIWKATNSAGGSSSLAAYINTAGQFVLVDVDSVGTETVLTTVTITDFLDRWTRIDIIFSFPTLPATAGGYILLVNGFLVADDDCQFNLVGNHTQSELGKVTIPVSTGFELDLDDWCNYSGALTFLNATNSLGSHIRRHFVVSGTTIDWTPLDVQIENQLHAPSEQINSQLISAVASAEIIGVTDVLPPDVDYADSSGMITAAKSAVVGAYANIPLGQTAQLGYTEAGGALVNANVAGNSALFTATALLQEATTPPDISPFGVQFTHHPGATNNQVNGLGVNVEYSGIFGAEDFANFVARPRLAINHNCQYWNTVYGFLGAPADGMICVAEGTYTGNGLSQTITLPGPAHFIFIRNTSAAVGPIIWFATGLGASQNCTQLVVPNYMIRVWFDISDSSYKFTIAGSGNAVNQAATGYRYIAYCDPGARLNLCGAYNHDPTDYTSYDNDLCDAGFTAEFAFVHHQTPGQGVGTVGVSIKGPANSGNTGRYLNGTAATNWGSFAEGILNTRTDIHYADDYQAAYSLFRTSDGVNDPVFVQITSYTGNGSSPRNITLTPTSGRTPIFVLVAPDTAAPGIWRDSSHPTTVSSIITSGVVDAAAGITALSTDQITVGATLNSNGVGYNVFALCSGCGSGEPTGTQWVNPPLVPVDVAVLGNGGLTLNGSVPRSLLMSVSGIYTLVPGKTDDTLYDRQTGVSSVDMKIPNPTAKTGYIGG